MSSGSFLSEESGIPLPAPLKPDETQEEPGLWWEKSPCPGSSVTDPHGLDLGLDLGTGWLGRTWVCVRLLKAEQSRGVGLGGGMRVTSKAGPVKA